MLVCGIDEAGRGSVVGPLVVGGIAIEESDIPKLREIGAKDSKLLSHKQRLEIFRKMKKLPLKFMTAQIEPREIDARNVMGTNINQLEAIRMAEIINNLKPDRAIIDSPTHATLKFKNFLSQYLTHEPELVVSNYADERYVVVGAASIVAKLRRDSEMSKISKTVGRDLGIGYPTDPKTMAFVREVLYSGNPKFRKYIRYSWESCARIKDEKAQHKLSDF